MIVCNSAADSNTQQPRTLLANGWPAAWIAEDPDAAATSPEAVYEAARRYVAAGLSCIPIDTDEASKAPDPRRLRGWRIYQLRLPREDELQSWYEVGGPFGLAVLGGPVSGGRKDRSLEIIDFDSIELAAPWIERVEQRAAGLTSRLVMVLSPRPGLHIYFRSLVLAECQKLACGPAVDECGQVVRDEHGKPKKATLIEVKGYGGYCLVPPSPRRCHPRNRLYQLLEGSPDLTRVPTITAAEREILLEEAGRFDRWAEPQPAPARQPVRTVDHDGRRPGDDFERRASWADILVPHGWVMVGRRGDTEDWRRPGKEGGGTSGTVNYADSGLLYVFSTNADPLEEGRGYNKFHADAVLNHGGDFSKAAKALQAEGYGRQGLSAGRRSSGNVLTTILRTGG
jgi:putative DNA primase/helicase